MIYQLNFTTRGKSFVSIDGKRFRGPRTLYFDEGGIAKMRQRLHFQTYVEDEDYDVSVMDNSDILSTPNIHIVENSEEGRKLSLDFKI